MVSRAVLFVTPRESRSAHLALLPVGNRPLVAHALDALVAVGIEEVVVVAPPDLVGALAEHLDHAAEAGVSLACVAYEQPSFRDALTAVKRFVGDGPVLVHLGDSLSREGLEATLGKEEPGPADFLALVESPPGNGERMLALAGRPGALRTLNAAGVYVFGPQVFGAIEELKSAEESWDAEIASIADVLAARGGTVDMRPVHGWWRYRRQPEALLEANRFYLSGLQGSRTDATMRDTDLQGPVQIDGSARLSSTVIRGPTIIGPNAEISDAYIGPYTSIGADVVIENAEVEHSIILPEASIRHLGARLEASIVGPRARIFRDFRLPKAFRLNVGEGAEVALT
jgi:glucose-1-phosphate thymidylyltransferase